MKYLLLVILTTLHIASSAQYPERDVRLKLNMSPQIIVDNIGDVFTKVPTFLGVGGDCWEVGLQVSYISDLDYRQKMVGACELCTIYNPVFIEDRVTAMFPNEDYRYIFQVENLFLHPETLIFSTGVTKNYGRAQLGVMISGDVGRKVIYRSGSKGFRGMASLLFRYEFYN